MITPIELISKRLEEISKQLVVVLDDDYKTKEAGMLVKLYNHYFIALQLLDSHSEIKHIFSKLYVKNNGKVMYKMISVKNHIHGINSILK